MPQTNDEKLEVLGRFATAAGIRSNLGTKLLVNQQTGDLAIQDSGFKTWWARSAADSLTNPAVHRHVTNVFETALRERNLLLDQNRCVRKIQNIHCAFKGYSTLVRNGYGGNETLIHQVGEIAQICCELVVVPYSHALSQTSWLPPGHGGACWAFVLDWLRRSFKGKSGYQNAKLGRKMGAIEALQADQLAIRARGRTELVPGMPGYGFGYSDVRLVDPQAPAVNQAAYQGRNVPAAGNAAQRFSPRFDGMMYRIGRLFPIVPAERRCYGVRGPGTPYSRVIGDQVLQHIEEDARASVAVGDSDRGWVLSLGLRDYFSDALTAGHALGIRYSPCQSWATFFDPNSGTGEIPATMADLWIESVILEYSFGYAVESITVHRVSAA
jgi:hypothetical protein